MAVQQRRKTRSKRDLRRMQDGVTVGATGEEVETGEIHRRHHISADGFYRGRQVIVPKAADDDTEEE